MDMIPKERLLAPGRLTINLTAIQENYGILKNMIGKTVSIAPVIKANAYGLGMIECAGALIKAGAKNFFVATPDEAIALRAAYAEPEIMVLNGFYESYAGAYPEYNLTPVLGSFLEIREYQALCKTHEKNLPAFLHFNTRMNRMGLGSIEREEIFENPDMLNGIDIKCVMSHLACADEPERPLNKIQLEIFQEIAARFPDAQKSFANAPGTFLGPEYHFDMIRPGMALWGLNPVAPKATPMKQVVSLEVPVIRTRIVFKDAIVGYGAAYKFEKDTTIAVVSAGYADGIFRSLGNTGKMYWQGYPCPIRGRISMDLTTIDLSNIPENERPKPGDMLELLGTNQSPDDLAEDAGTIGYEILTTLGQRYERIYKSYSGLDN